MSDKGWYMISDPNISLAVGDTTPARAVARFRRARINRALHGDSRTWLTPREGLRVLRLRKRREAQA